MAHAVQADPAGFLSMDMGRFQAEPAETRLRVLVRLIEAVTCAQYGPDLVKLQRLTAALDADRAGVAGTLSGCVFERAGERLWVYREAGRTGLASASVEAGSEAVWDGRYSVEAPLGAGGRIAPLGGEGRRALADCFAEGIPRRAIETVPAVFAGNDVLQVAGRNREPQRKDFAVWKLRHLHPFMRTGTQWGILPKEQA